jgi:hypothetical protein
MNCRSIAEKGPTTEEKVMAIEASLATYEAKISGLGKISRRTSFIRSSLHSIVLYYYKKDQGRKSTCNFNPNLL